MEKKKTIIIVVISLIILLIVGVIVYYMNFTRKLVCTREADPFVNMEKTEIVVFKFNILGKIKSLNEISQDLKLVTVLYYYDEFSVKEISEMLNIPEGTVKSRLARARDKMYEILKKEEGERIG